MTDYSVHQRCWMSTKAGARCTRLARIDAGGRGVCRQHHELALSYVRRFGNAPPWPREPFEGNRRFGRD